jgi:hypothetical protein
MNQIKTAEPKNTTAATPVPQAKRYDDAFKRQAVELWIKTGKPGTQIARELGVSYPCGSAVTMATPRPSGTIPPRKSARSKPNWPACASSGTY